MKEKDASMIPVLVYYHSLGCYDAILMTVLCKIWHDVENLGGPAGIHKAARLIGPMRNPCGLGTVLFRLRKNSYGFNRDLPNIET